MNPMKKFLKKQWLNILGLSVSVFILVYFCATNGIGALVQCFTSLNTIWLVAALACLVFYWLFEAGSLHVLIRYIYPKITFPHSFRLSMIGLFYSALTPFSTGGQPMELYEMTSKYGMNGAYSCSILTRKAIVFQSVATLAGVLAFIFGYGFFRTNVPQFSFITIRASLRAGPPLTTAVISMGGSPLEVRQSWMRSISRRSKTISPALSMR